MPHPAEKPVFSLVMFRRRPKPLNFVKFGTEFFSVGVIGSHGIRTWLLSDMVPLEQTCSSFLGGEEKRENLD